MSKHVSTRIIIPAEFCRNRTYKKYDRDNDDRFRRRSKACALRAAAEEPPALEPNIGEERYPRVGESPAPATDDDVDDAATAGRMIERSAEALFEGGGIELMEDYCIAVLAHRNTS